MLWRFSSVGPRPAQGRTSAPGSNQTNGSFSRGRLNMRIDPDVKLDFCDVLIKPQWSKAPSRSSVELDREFTFKNCAWKGVPIIAANLDTVGTFPMAKAMAEHGMMTCLHKHYPLDRLVEFFQNGSKGCFYTLGIKTEDMQKLDLFAQ